MPVCCLAAPRSSLAAAPEDPGRPRPRARAGFRTSCKTSGALPLGKGSLAAFLSFVSLQGLQQGGLEPEVLYSVSLSDTLTFLHLTSLIFSSCCGELCFLSVVCGTWESLLCGDPSGEGLLKLFSFQKKFSFPCNG